MFLSLCLCSCCSSHLEFLPYHLFACSNPRHILLFNSWPFSSIEFSRSLTSLTPSHLYLYHAFILFSFIFLFYLCRLQPQNCWWQLGKIKVMQCHCILHTKIFFFAQNSTGFDSTKAMVTYIIPLWFCIPVQRKTIRE